MAFGDWGLRAGFAFSSKQSCRRSLPKERQRWWKADGTSARRSLSVVIRVAESRAAGMKVLSRNSR